MDIEIAGKTYHLEFTFYSMKLLRDLDLSVMKDIETKPFMTIEFVSQLFYGALNNNRKKVFSQEKSDELLEKWIMDGDVSLSDALDKMMNLLEESHFFKAAQK